MRESTVYVHMGWSMRYPFSPRTWSLEEWHKWLTVLKKAQVSRVMLWPGLEFVDVTSHNEILDMKVWLTSWVELCHDIGMKVWVGRSLNAYVKEAKRDLKCRDVTDCDYADILNSDDYNAHILSPLKVILADIPQIDGYWVIDRDPGSAMGSNPSDFVSAYAQQLDLCPVGTNPVYWMWGGWTERLGQSAGWRNEPQDFWREALLEFEMRWPNELKTLMCWNGHVKSGSEVSAQKYRFPYHEVEPEPSIPWSYEQGETACQESLGLMAPTVFNLQTPCLRTPHLLQKLDGQHNQEKVLGSTTWDDIEEHWCWNESFMNELKTAWQKMRKAIDDDAITPKLLDDWKQLTGCQFSHKRGFLYDKTHG